MAFIVFRLLAVLIIVDFSLSRWSMVGQMQTFIFSTNQSVDDVQISWLFNNGSTNFTYFKCSIKYGNNCVPYLDTITQYFSANITSISTSVISVFTINHVNLSLHNSVWFYSVDFNPDKASARFDLRVFAAAESPTCDEVTLLNESNIQTDCGTNNVFPGPTCLFTVKTNGSSEYELKQGHISYTQDQNLTTLYYKTNCTLVVSAAILGPGSHMFRVVMYPNITSDITEEMKRTSQYTTAIYLAYPKVVLGNDCYDKGYIKENETSNCTCNDESKSFLPTKIEWSTNNSDIQDKGKTMVFIAKRKGSFQCTISNHLNWKDEIVFQPNISYPPDDVRLNITKQRFDLCNDTNIFISGTCFVSEGNPEPSITVDINHLLMDITSIEPEREYMFNKTMKSPGTYEITCIANSKEYSENASSIKTVTVKGPPDAPTIFKQEIKENKSQAKPWLEITNRDTIICQSKGGYPILKNVSLTCGPKETHASNQDQVSLTLNNSNVTSGTCKCVVLHESSCLHNTATVQFKVVDSENSPATGQGFEKIYLGVGVASGLLVVMIALIFIVRNLRQRQFKNSSSYMADKLVNNEDIYFIKQENFGIHLSIYPEYTNVVTTMSSAVEAPKN